MHEMQKGYIIVLKWPGAGANRHTCIGCVCVCVCVGGGGDITEMSQLYSLVLSTSVTKQLCTHDSRLHPTQSARDA